LPQFRGVDGVAQGRGGFMFRLRMAVQHFFNPLHMYCRLKDMGLAGPTAHKMCRVYERLIYRHIL
jgi:hypothetical protein